MPRSGITRPIGVSTHGLQIPRIVPHWQCGGEIRTAMEQHEVSSGQLYKWRKQALSGDLSGFSALRIYHHC